MTLEIVIVLGLVFVAVILFATEKLPVDLVALIIMATLLGTGIISLEEGLSGFSNPATVTIGAMFVLSAGLFKTGAVNSVGVLLTQLSKRNFPLMLLMLMLTIGILSAFINNTAAVAIFLPIIMGVARDAKISASKLLMPLSFASMFGGVCTLIGTSTNILVNSIAVEHGQPGFSMFEFSTLGVIFLGVGILYMLTVGVHLIPARKPQAELTQKFGMGDYLTDIVLLPDAKSVGKPLGEAPLVHDLDIDVIGITRNGVSQIMPPRETVLKANDILRVRCDVEKIRRLQERAGVALKANMKWRDEDLESEQAILVEAVIAPNSALAGKSLKQIQFRSTFGATALAILHSGKVLHEKLGKTRLKAGDALLIEVKRDHLTQLKQHSAFVIVSETGLPEFRRKKVLPAALIMTPSLCHTSMSLQRRPMRRQIVSSRSRSGPSSSGAVFQMRRSMSGDSTKTPAATRPSSASGAQSTPVRATRAFS
ncbi:SLC13 family permease [candidate division KSB1 bacterium]|nr:SLC13 family permease [candidate division KSB1 bacterium]